jgi:trk system potassium uptake protein TrkH
MRTTRETRPTSRNPIPVATYMLGLVYLGLGAAMALLGLGDWAFGEDPRGFAAGSLVGLGLGTLLMRLGSARHEPGRSEALFTVALIWLAVPALGAIPFWVGGQVSYLDALFEAMSGFTTTGATILADFSLWSQGLFLWRSLIQWFGGAGILLIFIAVLPQLAVAGRQLFFAESTGVQKEKITPKLRQTANMVLRVYLGLTAACILLYWATGQPFFEAVCNALSTIPAGGFSPNPQSYATYPALSQWMSTLFMFLAGASFVLQYRVYIERDPSAVRRDPEFRVYGLLTVVAGLTLTAVLLVFSDYSTEAALRHAFFQVVSLMTTTGSASADFALWAVPAQAILMAIMFVGGSAGSAAGGIKVVRWMVIAALTRRELQRSIHPQAVLPLRLGSRSVGEEVLRSVAAFITLYTGIFAFGTLIFTLLEGDFVVAFSASAAFIGNVGPGLGEVGPMGSFSGLHPVSKVVAIIQMWAGRIEIIPVFLLLNPELWRRLRS